MCPKHPVWAYKHAETVHAANPISIPLLDVIRCVFAMPYCEGWIGHTWTNDDNVLRLAITGDQAAKEKPVCEGYITANGASAGFKYTKGVNKDYNGCTEGTWCCAPCATVDQARIGEQAMRMRCMLTPFTTVK
jgi:hypothetical protein